MKEYTCARCRGYAPGIVTLASVYDAYLCVPCRNAWRHWLDEQPLWHEIRKLEIQAQADERCGPRSMDTVREVREALARIDELRRELRAEAAKWCQEVADGQ